MFKNASFLWSSSRMDLVSSPSLLAPVLSGWYCSAHHPLANTQELGRPVVLYAAHLNGMHLSASHGTCFFYCFRNRRLSLSQPTALVSSLVPCKFSVARPSCRSVCCFVLMECVPSLRVV